uniref:Uncharacterized protein n=1 Tax=Anguilla anguilla TaxID=7936 RepID=A0A0E9VCN1_ANGAN
MTETRCSSQGIHSSGYIEHVIHCNST